MVKCSEERNNKIVLPVNISAKRQLSAWSFVELSINVTEEVRRTVKGQKCQKGQWWAEVQQWSRPSNVFIEFNRTTSSKRNKELLNSTNYGVCFISHIHALHQKIFEERGYFWKKSIRLQLFSWPRAKLTNRLTPFNGDLGFSGIFTVRGL